MKAIRIYAHGGVDQLRIDELEIPRPNPRQVLVEVKAASMNHLDIWVRKGLPGIKLPITLGSDAAGVVKEVGNEVTEFKPGDRVLGQPGHGCGLCGDCQGGRENYCSNYVVLGEHVPGVQAQYIVVDESQLIRQPANVTFEEGAAIPLVFLTAWEMLVNKCRIRPMDTVLVVAASSGVGSAAVQIAQVHGARVIATAGTTTLEKARSLGAEFVLDHYKQDVAKEVKKITAGGGVDIVVDHSGSASWPASMRSLGRGGRLVVCGATTGFEVSIDLRFLFNRQQAILGSSMGQRGDMFRILHLIEAGKMRAVVDKVFPFTDVAKAHEYLESGRQFGKVILSFAD